MREEYHIYELENSRTSLLNLGDILVEFNHITYHKLWDKCDIIVELIKLEKQKGRLLASSNINNTIDELLDEIIMAKLEE